MGRRFLKKFNARSNRIVIYFKKPFSDVAGLRQASMLPVSYVNLALFLFFFFFFFNLPFSQCFPWKPEGQTQEYPSGFWIHVAPFLHGLFILHSPSKKHSSWSVSSNFTNSKYTELNMLHSDIIMHFINTSYHILHCHSSGDNTPESLQAYTQKIRCISLSGYSRSSYNI